MLKQKRSKTGRKNPNSKDEKEKARQREIADFIATRGVTRVEGRGQYFPNKGKSGLIGVSSVIKDSHARCQICDSWTDESGELHHYDWCPTYKKSRKNPSKKLSRRNPVKTRKSDYEYTDLIEVNTKKTSKDRIFLIYQGNEIEFTGKDAEELRDILKYQLSLFRRSSKLQKEYPEYLDSAGGYNTYITEQLQKVYPKVFR